MIRDSREARLQPPFDARLRAHDCLASTRLPSLALLRATLSPKDHAPPVEGYKASTISHVHTLDVKVIAAI